MWIMKKSAQDKEVEKLAHPTNPVEQTCGTNLKTIDKRYMKSLKAVPLAS